MTEDKKDKELERTLDKEDPSEETHQHPNNEADDDDEYEYEEDDDLKILEQLSYESFKEGQSLCSLCNDPKQWRPTGEYYSTYAAQYAAAQASSSSAATLARAREQSSAQIRQYEETIIGVYGAYIASHLDREHHSDSNGGSGEDLTTAAERIANSPTSSSNSSAPTSSSSESVNSVALEFYSSEFDISDPSVFCYACGLDKAEWRPDERLAQLEGWLDVVDARITAEVSRKGADFFRALATLEQLRGEVKRMSAEVVGLASVLSESGEGAESIRRCLGVYRNAVRKANYVRTLEALRLMSVVAEARRAVDVLIAQSDFNGALDLIERSRALLASALAGVTALRRWDLQFREVAAGIEQRVHSEFVRLATAPVPPAELARNGLESRREAFATVAASEVRLSKLHLAVDMSTDAAVAALSTATADLVCSRLFPSSELPGESAADRESVFGIGADSSNSSSGSEEKSPLSKAAAEEISALTFTDYIALVEALVKWVGDYTRQASMVRDVVKEALSADTSSSSLAHHVLSESFLALKRVVLAGHDRIRALVVLRGDDVHSTLAKLTRLRDVLEPLCAEAEAALGDSTPWSPVRTELARHMHLFLSEMQARDVKKVLLLLDNESWTTTAVAPDFQRIMDDIAGGAELAAGPDSSATLRIGSRRFKVVSSLLMLASLLTSYVQLPASLPQLAREIPRALAELIQVFHRRVHQLILGAEATKVLNIKSISAKFLAVAAQTLTAIIDLVPHLRATLYTSLKTPEEFNSLQHLDAIEQDLQDHLNQIFDKFVTLIAERVQARLTDENGQYSAALKARPLPAAAAAASGDPCCSQNMARLYKEIASLHRVMAQYMFPEQIAQVFEKMCAKISQETKEIMSAPSSQLMAPDVAPLLLEDFTYLASSVSALKHVTSSLDELLDWIHAKINENSATSEQNRTQQIE